MAEDGFDKYLSEVNEVYLRERCDGSCEGAHAKDGEAKLAVAGKREFGSEAVLRKLQSNGTIQRQL